MSRPVVAALLGVVMLTAAVGTQGADGSMDRTERKEAAQINAQLALTYLKQDNLQAARDKIEKALKQDPDTAGTQMAAGFVYDRLGQDDKAASHFEQAVKLDRDNADVLNNAAVFLCRKGDRKKGESYFLRAAASPLYRTPEVAYSNAGRCARADGRPKDAERYYRQSLAIRPDQPDGLLALAGILHEDGNDLSARAFLQRYSAAAPATPESLWLGYQLETSLGDKAAAGEYAQRLQTEFATSSQAAQLFEAERANP